MKSCVVCQSELKDDARFCPNCGAEQPKSEVAPGEDPLLGAIIAKKFKVEKVLGVGGMGKVYKARQLALDKAVVVKVLHDQFRDDPQLVKRFQQEARAASRLNHPNSIQIIDFGQDDSGVVFMAMEFLNGSDLFAHLKKEGPLDAVRLAKVMIQVCSALAEAHEMNVIHRDLKPENIMIEDRRGQRDFVKVLDFGIAKIQDPEGPGEGQAAMTQAGMVCGTPEYMSPEQARGLKLDARSDIYALGVIMYQLSTGDLPFTAETPLGIVTKHILEKPVPPRQKRPQIPEELERIILKAMEKDVANRFATVVEMGEALERLLQGLPNSGNSGGFSRNPGTSSGEQSGAFERPSGPTSGVGGQTTSTGVGSSGPTSTAATPGAGGAIVASTSGSVAPLTPGRPAASPVMKIAAAAVVVVLLAVVAAVALKGKVSDGVTADAGVVVAVVPVVVDAGAKIVVAPTLADAGFPEATPPPVVDAGTVVVVARPDAGIAKVPTPKPDAGVPVVAAPSAGARAAAKALLNKAVPAFNKEFVGAGCTDPTVQALFAAAKRDPTYPDPLRYIAQCQWKAKDFGASCAAAREYEKRGGDPVQAGRLKQMGCK